MSKTYTAHCLSGGIYQYDRRVTVDKPISGHEYSQCGYNVRYDEELKCNVIQLISYETIVAEIVGDWLHCYGTFSQTTRKHIGWFMWEMRVKHGYRNDLSNYQTAKRCYEKDIEVNLYNGDERKASLGMVQTVGVRVNNDW